MRIVLKKGSDRDYEKYVEVETLEQFVNLVKETCEYVLVGFDPQVTPEAFKEPAELMVCSYDFYLLSNNKIGS